MASVQIEMQFESRAPKPSELRYRVAVPEGSELSALEVCNASGCRRPGARPARRRGGRIARGCARRQPGPRAGVRRARPTIKEAATDPSQVELAPFARAVTEAELGLATRFEAVWAEAAPWFKKRAGSALRPLIVIIGDGGLTEGQAKPFASARALGVEVAALNLAERGVSRGMRAGVLQTGGIVIDAGAEAESAARRRDPAPLRERLSALFAPTLARASTNVNGRRIELGPLRAGELLAWQGRANTFALEYGSGRTRSASAAEHAVSLALAARIARDADPENKRNRFDASCNRRARPRPRCALSGPSRPRRAKQRAIGAAQRAATAASAAMRSRSRSLKSACKPAPKAQVAANDAGAEIGSGMPSSPLLSMLRQRIMPVARGCFRRDRAGRADYQVRAVFEFQLADREVVSAQIQGKIADDLRRCLLRLPSTPSRCRASRAR